MSLALVRPCLGLFPLCAHGPLFQISYYSLALLFCFFLLLHPCCSHAQCILCGIHTPCIGSPFPAVHAKWSLVFQSVNNSYWPKASLSPVLIKNNDTTTTCVADGERCLQEGGARNREVGRYTGTRRQVCRVLKVGLLCCPHFPTLQVGFIINW